MFAVYTPSGQVFSGSLEQLRRVEKINPATSARQAESSMTQAESENNQALIKRSLKGHGDNPSYKMPDARTQQYLSHLSDTKQREPIYQAFQVMSTNVQVLLNSWSIDEAFKTFQAFPYHLFPIVDSNRTLLGSLSRRRFYEFLLDRKSSQRATNQTIGNCFLDEHTRAYSADPVTDVRRIIRLLIDKNLDALTIVEDKGKIVGIVSRSDILQCTIAEPPLSLWC